MMNVSQRKRKYRRLPVSRSKNAYTRHPLNLLHGILQQPVFISCNFFNPHVPDIFYCLTQTYNTYKIRSSGLKLKRQAVISRLSKTHLPNHFPSPLPGRHLFQQRFLTIQNTHTGRTIQFMTGKHQKITIQLPDINRQMLHSLSCIHQYFCSHSVSPVNNGLHRIYRSQYIRNISHSHQLHFLRQQMLQLTQIQCPVIQKRNYF